MKPEIRPLDPGLYLVATPIGNARDITLRALDILASADVIAAEDTRTARKLMELHGIVVGKRPLIPYHDHSGANGRAGIVKLIGEGRAVAYVSEAGTPLVADPGYALAREVGRRAWLQELVNIPATLVIFESPKRIKQLLDDLCETADDQRQAAVARELTKKFEEVMRGSLAELRDSLSQRSLKGEVVLVLDRGTAAVSDDTMEAALAKAMKTMSVKDAAATVAAAHGLPRRKVYQAALEMAK